MYWISKEFGYYENDRISLEDEEVDQRTDANTIWIDGKWVIPTPTKEQTNAAILAQIDVLEASQTRSVRESALNIAGGATKLASINNQIDALRATLVP